MKTGRQPPPPPAGASAPHVPIMQAVPAPAPVSEAPPVVLTATQQIRLLAPKIAQIAIDKFNSEKQVAQSEKRVFALQNELEVLVDRLKELELLEAQGK